MRYKIHMRYKIWDIKYEIWDTGTLIINNLGRNAMHCCAQYYTSEYLKRLNIRVNHNKYIIYTYQWYRGPITYKYYFVWA